MFGPSSWRRRAHRVARLESVEPRLLLSAQPIAELCADYDLAVSTLALESQAVEQPAPALMEAHEQTGLNEAQAEYGLTGAGQTVVVIDTGIAYDHEALGGGFGEDYLVVGGYDFCEYDSDPYDDGPFGGHGTHVAGIIASSDSNNPGVAPGVDLVSLRVFDDNGMGTFQAIEEALQWVHENRFAFENPITTVNLSLGSDWNSESLPGWAMLEDELAQLEADGLFIAAAAGNSYTSYNQQGLSYPAASSHVVAVGSVDANGSLSYFSQRATSMIAAPGRSITSTVPDYLGDGDGMGDDFAQFSGTSMATPYVAASSVLLREAYAFAGMENVDQQTLYDTLVSTADSVYDPLTGESYYCLNLDAALDAVMPEDEFGSTAAEAYGLGTIVDTYSIQGTINTLGDADWFTFTAGVTGTVTFSAEADGEFSPIWQGAAAGALSFDVVAGQTYTLGLATEGGLVHYTLDASIEAAQTTIDLGTVEQTRFDGLAISGSGQRFTITAAADGILTVEALFAHAAGDVDIDLYDADGRLVGSCYGIGDSERIDVDAFAGQTFVLHAYVYGGGTNADVDLQVTNLIELDGSIATVRGTTGDDLFVFDAATGELEINGVGYQFRSVVVDQVVFDGRGGSDAVVLSGSTGDDSASIHPDSVRLSGDGYVVEAADVEDITVYSGGGTDTATFFDSAGDDTFCAAPGDARMLGSGFENRVSGFIAVEAYATAGGNDTAELYDSAGDDTFVASSDRAQLYGSDYSSTTRYFETVRADASAGGNDVARLFDSAGNDTFVAGPDESCLYGPGYSNTASYFDAVYAYATAGGRDAAELYDSAGDDTFVASPSQAQLYGLGYANTAWYFETVRADASAGGSDVARLFDSTGNDTFLSGPDESRLYGRSFSNTARYFDAVHAYATAGGNDVAELYDSAGDDVFRATSGEAALYGLQFYNRAKGFEQVRAVSDSGGIDRASVTGVVDFLFMLEGGWS